MDCDTEDELDIDVVGSDSETEDDQAISDAQEWIFKQNLRYILKIIFVIFRGLGCFGIL